MRFRPRLLWRIPHLSSKVLSHNVGYIIIGIVLCCIYLLIRSVFQVQEIYQNGNFKQSVNLSKNYLYFPPVKLLKENFSLLINNSKCRIPNFDIWNEEVIQYHEDTGMPCLNINVNMTFVDRYTVRINEEAIRKQGYNPANVTCCYKTIIRVEKKESEKNSNDVDNIQRHSRRCYHIQNEIVPISSFIVVYCKLKASDKIIYSNHHLVAVLPDKNVIWLNAKNSPSFMPPPNIFVIGLDSTTRLNMRRNMPNTSALLEDKLGAVEMKGYTKVGENTLPNLIPMLTSLNLQELIQTCYPARDTPFDSCPFIWKKFKKRNYLTAFVEDNPYSGSFNFARSGFHRAPVDIYSRNFMIDAYKLTEGWNSKCFESHRHEKAILEFTANLAALSESKGMSYFIITWLSEVTHTHKNGAQFLDSIFVGALVEMHQRGMLENTFLFIIGDHGYRFGDFRTTISGWYEDKLPVLWVKPPEKMTRKFPVLLETLKLNSLQTATAFDLYATFTDIMNMNQLAFHSAVVKVQDNNSKKTNLRGLSLLKNLPERSCSEAGIPEIECPCVVLEKYNNEKVVYLGALTAVSYINSRIPTSVCHPLSVTQVFAAGVVWNLDNSVEEKPSLFRGPQQHQGFLLYVGLTVIPGEFKFEAVVKFINEEDLSPTIIKVQRTSLISRPVECLNDIQNLKTDIGLLLQFCFCK